MFGEYFSSSMAVSQYLKCSRGCRVSACTILMRPCCPPMARCWPHLEYVTSLQSMPRSDVRSMVRCLALQTKTRDEMQQEAYLSESFGCALTL